MAFEIQLPERRAIGATGSGQAKSGLDLADGSLEETGKAITEFAMFAGKHFDNIRKAKDVNEEADALGALRALNESFNTFAKTNPNASPEQLRAFWESDIKAEVKQLGVKYATGDNAGRIQDVMDRNLLLLGQKAHTTAAARGTAQQRARFEQHAINLRKNLDEDGMRTLAADGIVSGIIDEETWLGPEGKGGGRLDNELDFIAVEKEKERLRIEAEIAEIEYGDAQQDAFNAWRGTITGENPEGDINVGLESINKDPRIPNQDKQEAESELKARASSTMSQADEAIKVAILESDNAIQKKINDKDTAGIVEFIRSQAALDEVQKGSWIDAVEKDAEAKLKDDEQNSPFNRGSDSVFQKWLNAAQTDPKSFDMNDMTELTKKPDGITTAQWRTINSTRNTSLSRLETGEDPLNSRTAKLGNEYLDTFKKDDAEAWLQTVNDFNKWYLDFTEKNKREPTARESETKLQFLTTPIVRKFWVNDLPDAEIKTELRGIPLEGQKAFVESAERGESTTEFLKLWRAKPKKFTRKIAIHYLSIADNNVEKADELAIRDGYTE